MNSYEKLANKFIKRLQRLMDKYGNDVLLGFINVFDEEYDFLKKYSSDLLQNLPTELIKSYPEYCLIIALTLVQIAIRETSDEKEREFWVVVRDTLGIENDKALKSKEILYQSIVRDNNLFFYMNETRHEYVRTVDSHAIIPNISVNKIYDVLFSAYQKDLEEDYDENFIDDYIDIMFNFFKAYISFDDEEDDRVLLSGVKISKHYMLPKPFRVGCLNNKAIMKDFIKKSLFYINEASFTGLLPEDSALFAKEFVTWWKYDHHNKIFDDSKKRIKYEKNEKQKKYKKRFTSAYFELQGTDLILNLPQQRLTVNQIENEIVLNTYDGDDLIPELCKKLKVFGQIMFRTEEEQIKLNKIIKKLRYEIKSGNEIIYDSKEKFYRESIIFNFDGSEELDGKNLYVGDIKIVTSLESEVVPDCTYDKILKEQYIIYVLFLKESSSFLLNNKFYSLESQKYESQMFYENKSKEAYIDYNGEIYDIYTQWPSFGIRCEGIGNAKKYIININESQMYLSSFGKIQTITLEDGSGDEYLNCIMIERQIEKCQFYSIVVRKAGDSKYIIKENFIIIPEFKCLFDKEYYYKEKNVTITEIVGNNLNFHVKFPHTILYKTENHTSLLCEINSVACEIKIELPIISWKIEDYNSFDEEDNIWHKNIQDYILLLKCSYVDPKVIIGNTIVRGDKKYSGYYYNLRDFFLLGKDFEIGIDIKGNYIKLLKIIFAPTIIAAEFRYKKNMQLIFGNWKYIGDGELFIEIFTKHKSKKLFSKKLMNVNCFEEQVYLPDGFYRIIISQEQDDEFGISNEKINLYDGIFVAGDKFYFLLRGKDVKVDNCFYFDQRYDINNFYFDNLNIEQENSLYIAKAFFFKKSKQNGEMFKWYLRSSNPVRIEIIDVNKNLYTIEIRDHTDDGGFIYDIQDKHILPFDKDQKDRNRYQTADYYILDLEGLT
ncbi:MAG: hypothetical protein GXY86_02400 [Firmicutes bacterium]|nr:hypothetical protein [Bacillota bacterium]